MLWAASGWTVGGAAGSAYLLRSVPSRRKINSKRAATGEGEEELHPKQRLHHPMEAELNYTQHNIYTT